MDQYIKFRPARITEYKGRIFKSKSEAIFARVLEQHVDPSFEYEPEWTKLPCGYVADFDIVRMLDAPIFAVDMQAAIEYKPSTVTDTFKSELLQRFNAIRQSQVTFTTTAIQYILVSGNAYDDEPCTIEIMDDSGSCFVPGMDRECVSLKQWLIEEKDYRFDLKVCK